MSSSLIKLVVAFIKGDDFKGHLMTFVNAFIASVVQPQVTALIADSYALINVVDKAIDKVLGSVEDSTQLLTKISNQKEDLANAVLDYLKD